MDHSKEFRDALQQIGLTGKPNARELADLLGFTTGHIANILSGRRPLSIGVREQLVARGWTGNEAWKELWGWPNA